ncbi:MPN domain-containing protein [Favolaschia claudopus]|uniref:MPN domain-containing protein n=1 Tax=Favolaschia claudopus TaxID=2862362 RepID=A0AAW0ECD6_9AGAR
MNKAFYFLFFLLPRIAQSAPNSPLYLSPPDIIIQVPSSQDATESSTATPTVFQDSPQPIPTQISDEVPFLLPVPPQSSSKFSNSPLVMAYYPDWAGSSFPPERIDFNRFDWIDFAFAIPNKDASLSWDDPDTSPALLSRLVRAAHAKGKKVKLSIGGWTGSQYFSSIVASDQTRRLFVQNILGLYNKFQLDGCDIDWEYPGNQGAGNNQVSPKDSANFLLFLQLLRRQLPYSAIITAAVTTLPFYGSNRQPMKDVSAFARVLDWVLLMNYDVWGASPNPGPNAPLFDNCNNSTQPDASAEAGFRAWTAAGFLPSQLVLGVPSYGYVSKSTATRLRTRQDNADADEGDNDNQKSQNVKLTYDGNQIQFRDLVKQGALTRKSDGTHGGSGGFTRYFDECSSTPWLRSASSRQIVTYDDTESLTMKAAYVKKVQMRGVNMFDVHGDTDGWDLVDSLRRGLA